MRFKSTAAVFIGISLSAALAACGADDRAGIPGNGPGGAGANGPGGAGFGPGATYTDFPGALLDEGAPADAPALFAAVAPGTGAAPCIIEPEPGTLLPKNWVAPRFAWGAVPGANIFEIRVKAANQTKELVVYTTKTSWTMPKPMWLALREHSADVAMTFEIRSAMYAPGAVSSVSALTGGPLTIAPVDAPGSIVYWSIQGENTSLLRGFTMGEDGVVDVLRSESMPQPPQGRACIGCHTSTPDGKSVAVTWESTDGEYTSVDLAQVEKGAAPGARPSYMSPSAATRVGQSYYPLISTFSPAQWAPGNRMMITNDGPELVWYNLEAQAPNAASGVLGKAGDPGQRRHGPTWSKNGNAVVYMSGTLADNTFEYTGPVDLYVMPFANKAGATPGAPARPVGGAADPNRAEYYPAISPDDQWISFTSIPDNGNLYDNPNAEIFLVPGSGGQRVRLRANDAPACTQRPSPGITNSWPKWAPEVKESNGRRYYFVVFSSRRNVLTDKPQLYVAPIQVDGTGVTSYPAIYIRNQEAVPGWQTWGNHTPAWDVFQIPPAPIK